MLELATLPLGLTDCLNESPSEKEGKLFITLAPTPYSSTPQ